MHHEPHAFLDDGLEGVRVIDQSLICDLAAHDPRGIHDRSHVPAGAAQVRLQQRKAVRGQCRRHLPGPHEPAAVHIGGGQIIERIQRPRAVIVRRIVIAVDRVPRGVPPQMREPHVRVRAGAGIIGRDRVHQMHPVDIGDLPAGNDFAPRRDQHRVLRYRRPETSDQQAVQAAPEPALIVMGINAVPEVLRREGGLRGQDQKKRGQYQERRRYGRRPFQYLFHIFSP